MPRSNLPRIDKHRHKARRAAPAVPAGPASVSLAELRALHPDVSDQEAALAVAITIDGKSMAECSTQYGWPPEWVRSSLSKAHMSAFCHDLGIRMLGADAHLARVAMTRLLNARSSYVRYAAAQDLMDRAGLRVRPLTPQPAAASITINIGNTDRVHTTVVEPNAHDDRHTASVVGTKPEDGFVTTIDAVKEEDGTHRAIDGSSETV